MNYSRKTFIMNLLRSSLFFLISTLTVRRKDGQTWYGSNASIKIVIVSLLLFFNFHAFSQTNSLDYLNFNTGTGKGLRFYNSDYYKIHMGNSSEYHYGPVTNFSIKMNMSSHLNRGWTWGVSGQVPVAALSNRGTMKIKGDMEAFSFSTVGDGIFMDINMGSGDAHEMRARRGNTTIGSIQFFDTGWQVGGNTFGAGTTNISGYNAVTLGAWNNPLLIADQSNGRVDIQGDLDVTGIITVNAEDVILNGPSVRSLNGIDGVALTTYIGQATPWEYEGDPPYIAGATDIFYNNGNVTIGNTLEFSDGESDVAANIIADIYPDGRQILIEGITNLGGVNIKAGSISLSSPYYDDGSGVNSLSFDNKGGILNLDGNHGVTIGDWVSPVVEIEKASSAGGTAEVTVNGELKFNDNTGIGIDANGDFIINNGSSKFDFKSTGDLYIPGQLYVEGDAIAVNYDEHDGDLTITGDLDVTETITAKHIKIDGHDVPITSSSVSKTLTSGEVVNTSLLDLSGLTYAGGLSVGGTPIGNAPTVGELSVHGITHLKGGVKINGIGLIVESGGIALNSGETIINGADFRVTSTTGAEIHGGLGIKKTTGDEFVDWLTKQHHGGITAEGNIHSDARISANTMIVGKEDTEWLAAYDDNDPDTNNDRGYSMVVTGNFIAEQIAVAPRDGFAGFSWPDYVFADDYQLPSLASVEAYIQQEQHLPEVPSAAEVSQNGFNLEVMDATLLQKVEELTLYLIEQNKRIESLEAQLANQK